MNNEEYLKLANDILNRHFGNKDIPKVDEDKFINFLEESIDRVNGSGWISVNDRLPKCSGEYLVTCISSFFQSVKIVNFVSRSKNPEWITKERVIAWMEKPKGYWSD